MGLFTCFTGDFHRPKTHHSHYYNHGFQPSGQAGDGMVTIGKQRYTVYYNPLSIPSRHDAAWSLDDTNATPCADLTAPASPINNPTPQHSTSADSAAAAWQAPDRASRTSCHSSSSVGSTGSIRDLGPQLVNSATREHDDRLATLRQELAAAQAAGISSPVLQQHLIQIEAAAAAAAAGATQDANTATQQLFGAADEAASRKQAVPALQQPTGHGQQQLLQASTEILAPARDSKASAASALKLSRSSSSSAGMSPLRDASATLFASRSFSSKPPAGATSRRVSSRAPAAAATHQRWTSPGSLAAATATGTNAEGSSSLQGVASQSGARAISRPCGNSAAAAAGVSHRRSSCPDTGHKPQAGAGSSFAATHKQALLPRNTRPNSILGSNSFCSIAGSSRHTSLGGSKPHRYSSCASSVGSSSDGGSIVDASDACPTLPNSHGGAGQAVDAHSSEGTPAVGGHACVEPQQQMVNSTRREDGSEPCVVACSSPSLGPLMQHEHQRTRGRKALTMQQLEAQYQQLAAEWEAMKA